MKLILIAAVDKNWGLGYKGKLLYNIPEDMKRFQTLTKESGVVIMGNNTFKSLNCHPLKGRENIILTSNKKSIFMNNGSESVLFFNTVKDILRYLRKNKPFNRIFVIGGSMIYKEFMKYCTEAYITKIEAEAENVDSYFPKEDLLSKDWKLKSSIYKEYDGLKYSFDYYCKEEK